MKTIKLEWKGDTYVIPENEVFEAVDEMEEHITLATIAQDAQALRMGRLSKAFSVLLKHAGAPDCEPAEVRRWMSASIKKMLAKTTETGRQPSQTEVQEIFFGAVVKELSDILMDGAPEPDGGEEEKPASGKKTASSKKRSR